MPCTRRRCRSARGDSGCGISGCRRRSSSLWPLSIHGLDLDRRISRAWFFDADEQAWIGAGRWWANNLIHRGGNALVWMIGLAMFATLLAGRWIGKLRPYRRKAVYLVVGMALCATVVGVLKLATNVDCPRDLEEFGGTHPYVQLFEDRPDSLPRGQCFPGSHASTGFALMAFYFVLFDTRARLARILLTVRRSAGVDLLHRPAGTRFPFPVPRPHERRAGLVRAAGPLVAAAKIARRQVAIDSDWTGRPTSGYERPAHLRT